MSYNNYQFNGTASVVCDNSEVIDLISQSIEDNAKCCSQMTKYMIGITQQLNTHGIILNSLLRCCPQKPKPFPIYVGQAINDITPNVVVPRPKPIQHVQDMFIVKPCVKVNEMLYKYPAEVGYFTILGIPAQFKVIGKRIKDKNGLDLLSYLPVYFNEEICNGRSYRNRASNNINYRDCIELIAIRGYSVKNTPTALDAPILIYETKNLFTGAIKTFEGSINLWDKYSR